MGFLELLLGRDEVQNILTCAEESHALCRRAFAYAISSVLKSLSVLYHLPLANIYSSFPIPQNMPNAPDIVPLASRTSSSFH